MITVKVYDDYNSIVLQAADTDDLEGREFSILFFYFRIRDSRFLGCHLVEGVTFLLILGGFFNLGCHFLP